MSPETVVKTIKKSLAGVLSTFYPLAGEIVPNSHGEPEVLCNNSGVEFVHAYADVELKDLDFYRPDHSVRGKLMPNINHGLLSVQIEQFGNPIEKIKIPFWNSRSRGVYYLDKVIFDVVVCIFHGPQLDSRMYYVPAESIERIQSEASTKETKRSKLLSFTAFLWKLLADGDNDAANTTSRMGIVVNGRRFLIGNTEKNSSLFENHFGNVLSVPYGVAANSDLKAMPLHKVTNGVHRFVAEATNEEHFRGLIDWVQLHRPTSGVSRIYTRHEKSDGGAVVVSSGQGLPIEDMDFGWGKPEFGSYHAPWNTSPTGYVCTMPSASRNGDCVVYMLLKQKELHVIEHMAPNVFTPLSIAAFF